MPEKIYLDHNATTPIKPAVLDLMHQILSEPGNASSVHSYGRAARSHVEKAREQVAKLVNVSPSQVIFTSGATESDNTIVKSYHPEKVFISAVEHSAVSRISDRFQIIPLTGEGLFDLEALEQAFMSRDADLVCAICVNNETGNIQPIKDIVHIAKKYGAAVHTDAAQAVGRIPVDFQDWGVDYLCLSAHKFGGPQGVGALIYAPGKAPQKFMHGGSQERYQRAGTENVAGIAGMGLAAELAVQGMESYQSLGALRDRMEQDIKAQAPEAIIYGEKAPRVSNTSNICLPGVPAETQLMNLDLEGIAVSTGSACSSGKALASDILVSMGATEDQAKSALRVSLGWNTKEEEIERFIEIWMKMYHRFKDKIP